MQFPEKFLKTNGGFYFWESAIHLIINVNLKIVWAISMLSHPILKITNNLLEYYLYNIIIKTISDEKHLCLLNNVVSKFPLLIK